MQFRLLGPLEVCTTEGQPARLGAEKHRILVAVLLLSANRWVPLSSLVRAIWPRNPPRSAAAVLRTYASALRKTLLLDSAAAGTRLDARHGAYQLRVVPAELDVLVFEELAANGQKALAEGDLPRAVAMLQRALALWRGQPLEDIPIEGEYYYEVTRLAELKLNVVESVAEAWLALGRNDEVLAWLTPLAPAQPLRERLYSHLMLALYRCGRQADALSTFQELRTRLVEQLGVEPSPPLQRLHRQILAGDPELDRTTVPPVAAGSPASVPRQLPPSLGSFTGRASELVPLRRALVDQKDNTAAPVLAIDGLGGVGKSALAVEVAHEMAAAFPDGTLYADLGGTSEAGRAPVLAILNRFLRAIGHRERPFDSLDEAASVFRVRTEHLRILVVLDNARDAAQVQPLLPGGVGCRTIVTSRQIMATLDHCTYLHLDVLTPAEAVALLGRLAGTDRIAAAGDAAAEIARLCGYLPLALRIAGARLTARPSWPVGALAERLTDAEFRLDQLQLGNIGVRGCFAASLHALQATGDLYDRAAATAFPLLTLLDSDTMSVGLAAALLGWPTGLTATVLERLVDEQLLDGRVMGRYGVHDLVRLFGRQTANEQCTPAEQIAAITRALTFYATIGGELPILLRPGDPRVNRNGRIPHDLAQGRVHPALAELSRWSGDPAQDIVPPPGPRFADAQQALNWLEFERTNIVAAIVQCGAVDDFPAALLTALVRALTDFFQLRGYWQDWIEINRVARLVASRVSDRVGEAYAERDLGLVHERKADYPQALAHLDAGLAIFRQLDERPGIASCLTVLGVTHARQGRYADAVACHQEGLALRRAEADPGGHALTLNHLGAAYERQGHHPHALDCYDKARAVAARIGDQALHAAILTNLGGLCERQARYADALSWLERARTMLRELDARDGMATCLTNLGRTQRRTGDFAHAVVCQEQALALATQLGARLTEAEALRELGAGQHGLGRHAEARVSWRRAQEILEDIGAPGAAEIRALADASDTPRTGP